ncbi:hypothetical protein LCGC14_2478720, partial [marine sediment metagenome]
FSATIGGGLSNSTAGGGSTKYGLVPDNCLGLEVVLPNPEGTIIRTGSWANKYAVPFCRYGVSPDFTGIFLGDVGTMGIKCKAAMRIYREHPYKANRTFLLKKYDYNTVFLLAKKIRYEIPDGLLGLSSFPPFYFAQFKIPNAKGPGISVTIEAMELEILEIYLKKLESIMKEDTIMMPAAPGANLKPNLKTAFHYFQAGISPVPGKIAMATCHKVPISTLGKIHDENVNWNNRHANDVPGSVMPGVFEATQYLLPNGNMVVLGGVAGENTDEWREKNMELWHSKIRTQVRYGGAHYWLGESISQAVAEAGAYTPEYEQFFRDMKKTVDPNFLLSPNKFHLHTYDSKFADYYTEPD